jgi:cobalt-precorrin 5A hydrolase
MYARGIAVVAITRRGVETAQKIQDALNKACLNSTVYAPIKYLQPGVVPLEKRLVEWVKDNYSNFDALVAVMATGITVRAIAPLLESKLTDPAVVTIDVSGKFVISLLSGHYGGANDLADIIAKGINAIPVITTASDVMGRQSVDQIAKNLHLTIQNPESLIAVNSAIVNGDRFVVVVVGEAKIPVNAISGYDIKKAQNGAEALDIIRQYDAGAIITYEPLTVTSFAKPFTILKTRKVVVGLGARKETPADVIIEAVDSALEQVHIPLARVHRFATVDIKRDSQPMLDAVAKLGAPLEFLSVDALRSLSHPDLSPDSAMVQEKIGVGGVCERAALLIAGKNSRLILKKTKRNETTVAIAEGE